MGLNYGRASVVVFDPVNVNLRTTQYALHQIGFREITCLTALSEVRRRINDNPPELLLCEATAGDSEVLQFVRDVRAGEVGHNPFIAMLLTSWARDGGALKQAISSGADDVVIRPFSTSFLDDRVRTLVRARKPFIVTSDYIGPDRRRDPARESGGVEPINAPNLLRSVVEGDGHDVEQDQRWIVEAREAVDSERLRRLAMRIVVGVEAAVREMDRGARPQIDAGDFGRAAKELRLRLARMRCGEASQIAQALCEITTKLTEPEGFNKANLGLAKELAQGAYAAYAGGDQIERSAEEIERTVQALRKRMAMVAAQSVAPSDTAPGGEGGAEDGGAEGSAELKRAAG